MSSHMENVACVSVYVRCSCGLLVFVGRAHSAGRVEAGPCSAAYWFDEDFICAARELVLGPT